MAEHLLAVGCETGLAWEKRRFWYEKKGTALDCLQKGQRVRLKADLPALTEGEQTNLAAWGVVFPPSQIAPTARTEPLDHKIQQLFPRPEEGHDLSSAQSIANPTEQYKLRDAQLGLSPNCWDALEDFTSNSGVQKNSWLVLGPRRAATPGVAGRTGQKRELRFLEESLSSDGFNPALDEIDILNIFACVSNYGVLFFVLPALTEHLGQDPSELVLCKIDFAFRRLSTECTLVFYCDKSTPSLGWYSRIMVQQFALPHESWKVAISEGHKHEHLLLQCLQHSHGYAALEIQNLGHAIDCAISFLCKLAARPARR